jgi:hypothetical protein
MPGEATADLDASSKSNSLVGGQQAREHPLTVQFQFDRSGLEASLEIQEDGIADGGRSPTSRLRRPMFTTGTGGEHGETNRDDSVHWFSFLSS